MVFDTAPSLSFRTALPLLKPRGVYIPTMPHLDVSGFARALFSRRKWGFLLEKDTDPERMTRLHTLMAQGAFRPVIDSIHPLSRAGDAFARQQQPGKRGKIMIDLREASG